MSRGTRRNDDVMGLMPDREEDIINPFPTAFPRSASHGTGRVGALNDRLLLYYSSIGNLSNAIDFNNRMANRCDPHSVGSELMIQICSRDTEREGLKSSIPGLIEVRKDYSRAAVYSVPEDCPAGNDNINNIERILTIGDTNSFLKKKYCIMGKHINRIRFLRDWCVRLEVDSTAQVPNNNLSSEIRLCLSQFDQAIDLIKKWQGSQHIRQLFTMPTELRDKVMEDNAVMDLRPLKDMSFLFSGGHHATRSNELYLLFPSALGYALFHAYGIDVARQSIDAARASVQDFTTFKQAVRLMVYYPFWSAIDTVNQCTAIFGGTMTGQLRSILRLYLPKARKGKQYHLAVADPKLGELISDTMKITCRCDDFVLELLRGIRLYFNRFVELGSDFRKAQLRPGHTYSRERLRFNVNDINVVNAICQLDTLNRDINSFSLRVRECFSLHFPELSRIIKDNYQYVKLVQFIINSHSIEPEDGQIVLRLAERVLSLSEYRQKIHEYIVINMREIAPHLSSLIGEIIGACLIAFAGGLPNLAEYPSSSLQKLGAEKAPSRGLIGGEGPKYGPIFESTFVCHASSGNKCRMARYLANQCSLACRKDCYSGQLQRAVYCFTLGIYYTKTLEYPIVSHSCIISHSEVPTSSYGEMLRNKVEEKLHMMEMA
ncbi:nucleolar protein 56-like [Panicum miliaceum]|uniref:Nucleolar protein 56 n=1 Tax=Panicum miliaceum TaxID=4540 RepID=A0A3L6TF32_PANMI|nr:nucleolar protein 56-like [Panicum miliaceum]